MVVLTMTPSIVDELRKRNESLKVGGTRADGVEADEGGGSDLDELAVGKPISHDRIVDLWKALRSGGNQDCSLEALLRGARVYAPPPPPKPEPTDEFKALMARLRREEEQRAYESMIRPPPGPGPPVPLSSSSFSSESFSRRFPDAHAFAEANRPVRADDLGDDDAAYADVHRQLMLILNVVLSVLGVAGALWVVARWWSTPARLLLSMVGSAAVGLVEVALFWGYTWHLGEARKKEAKVREVKRVVQSWVVGHDGPSGGPAAPEVVLPPRKDLPDDGVLRRRK